MLVLKKKIVPLILLIGLIISTVGCKTLLAPEYDKAIVEAVSSTSEKTMSFLAKVSEGTVNNNFSEREKEYNDLIGAYDALKIKAKARPIPNNIATKKINELLGTRGNALSGNYPSAFAFEEISKTVKKMKDTDKASGLKPTAVEAFKGQIEIFLDQALTYESFLKR
jgi:hypothetical protein